MLGITWRLAYGVDKPNEPAGQCFSAIHNTLSAASRLGFHVCLKEKFLTITCHPRYSPPETDFFPLTEWQDHAADLNLPLTASL